MNPSREIINQIDKAISELEVYISRSVHAYPRQIKIVEVLKQMKIDLESKGEIRERLLRGYKDICTSTAIYYEDTNYADSIFDVNNTLEEIYPKMKKLSLLGVDFGKGDPI